MPQGVSSDPAGYIRQIRGAPGEFAALLYLAAGLQDWANNPKLSGIPPERRLQLIALLKTRIAELCRFSEKRMNKAAVSLSQLGAALDERKLAAAAASHVEPIRLLLQEQINHNRQTVQVGMHAVSGLDRLTTPVAPSAVASKGVRRPLARKAAPSKKTTRTKTKSGAAKKSQGSATAKRTAVKKKRGAAEPSGGSGTSNVAASETKTKSTAAKKSQGSATAKRTAVKKKRMAAEPSGGTGAANVAASESRT